jgi:hypothetical protein
MEKKEKKKRIKSKEYLDKTFLEELNHKIWCTKGARFNADSRFKINQNGQPLAFHFYQLI